MQKKYFFLAATSKIIALSLFLFILILCAPSKKLLAQEFAQKRSQSFAYNFSSTILWQLGATTLAANPLVYYFFPFTYTRAISNRIAYSQFIMYRYEHYKNISSENPYSLWRRFHEIYILPGLRFKPKYNQHGKYVAFYAGFGRGIGPKSVALVHKLYARSRLSCQAVS